MKRYIFLMLILFFASCDRNALSEWEESDKNTVNDETAVNDNSEPVDNSEPLDNTEEPDDAVDEEVSDDAGDNEPDEMTDADELLTDTDEEIDDEVSDEPPLGGDCEEHEDCPVNGICDEKICVDPYGSEWTVTIVSVTLDENDPNTGEKWDNGLFGVGGGDPDPYVMMFQNGNLVIETEKGDETQSVTFSNAFVLVGFTSMDMVSFQVFEHDSTPGDDDDPAGEFADSWNGGLPGPISVESFRVGEMIFSGSGTAELIITLQKN